MPEVVIELTHPDAKMPTRATKGSACFDVYACEDATIEHTKVTVVDVGFKIHVPKGHEVVVRPRSGLALKHGVTIVNAPGTIDEDYRGPVWIILTSVKEYHFEDDKGPYTGYIIRKGDRIAQLKLQRVPNYNFVEGKVLDNTERGSGGFGSTGE